MPSEQLSPGQNTGFGGTAEHMQQMTQGDNKGQQTPAAETSLFSLFNLDDSNDQQTKA